MIIFMLSWNKIFPSAVPADYCNLLQILHGVYSRFGEAKREMDTADRRVYYTFFRETALKYQLCIKAGGASHLYLSGTQLQITAGLGEYHISRAVTPAGII